MGIVNGKVWPSTHLYVGEHLCLLPACIALGHIGSSLTAFIWNVGIGSKSASMLFPDAFVIRQMKAVGLVSTFIDQLRNVEFLQGHELLSVIEKHSVNEA
jgi:hypothetical protein